MTEPRTPGQRAGLTHALVLSAARELLAEQGLEALTMRALARRLQVMPNALYSHVANKTALVDDLLDQVLGEVQAPRADHPDAIEGLHLLMASTYDVLLAHPTLVPLYLARQGARGPFAVGLGEVMLALLGRVGVHGRPARAALRVLIVFTIGFAAFTTRPQLETEIGDGQTKLSSEELRNDFEDGLRWLLQGITSTQTGFSLAQRLISTRR